MMQYLVKTVDPKTREKSFCLLYEQSLRENNPKSTLNRNAKITYLYPEFPEPDEEQVPFQGTILANSSNYLIFTII